MNLQVRKVLKVVRLDRNAIQITALYWLIGGLWILLSDRFAEAISKDTQTLTTISTYKGWGYVLVTGWLLYWLIRRNNSQLHKEQEKLQTSEKNYRDIFDNATVGIYRSTPDGRLLMVNPELASMFRYDSPEEFLASINDIANQIYNDPARRQDFLKKLSDQGFIKEFINQERRKDGSIIWTSTTARVVKDDAGNVLYYEGFNIDITERKQAEEALKQRIEELERFNRATVGRELRMVELKKEVNELCLRLGQPALYQTDFAEKKHRAKAQEEDRHEK